MNKSINKFVIAGMVAVASYGVGSAQVLVGYNFTGLSGTSSNAGYNGAAGPQTGIAGAEATAAANTADSSAFASGTVGASVFSRGSNDTNQVPYGKNNYQSVQTAYFTANVFGVSNYQGPKSAGGAGGSSIATGITNGSYVTFSVSSVGATSLDLTDVKFAAGNSSGDNNQLLGLAYSINGAAFTTAGIDGGDSGLTYATAPANAYNNTPDTVDVDLSGITALQGVKGTVAFDLVDLDEGYATVSFGHGNNAFTSTASDDIVLDGTVVAGVTVPEPSTYALLGAGLLSLMVIARRKAIV